MQLKRSYPPTSGEFRNFFRLAVLADVCLSVIYMYGWDLVTLNDISSLSFDAG